MGWKNSLDDLLDTKVINRDVYNFVLSVVKKVVNDNPTISSDKLDMFATHISMATQRAIKGIEEEAISEEIMQQLKEEEFYDNALTIYNYIIENSVVEYSKPEHDFLLIHTCNLLRK